MNNIKQYSIGFILGVFFLISFSVYAGSFDSITNMTQTWFDNVKTKLNGTYTSGKMCTSDGSGQIQCITDIPSGNIPTTISKEYTDVFTTTSNTWVDVPGFSITITPTSTSSKILVMSNVIAGMGGAVTGNYRIVRDVTPIAIPPAVAGYTSVGSASFYGGSTDGNNNEESSITYLDSPGVVTPITYKIQVISLQSAIMRLNALGSDVVSQVRSQRARSSLTLMEVK